MSKPRSLALDYVVYAIVRVVVCVIQAIPLEWAYRAADGLARLIYKVNRRHRLVALDNLRHAFPGRYTEAELDGMVRQTYRHFCSLLMEIIHLPRRLHPNTWRRHLVQEEAPLIAHWTLSGRPLLIVTGHFGNWELAGYILGLFGFPVNAIARPLDNPFLDRFLRRFRESTGQRILNKNGDFDKIQAVLDRRGVLATLADQDAGQRGLFVDFFGRPASTHKAVALLALEHNVPLIVTGARKVAEPMRYRMMIADVILPEEYADRPDAVKAITQRFTSALERIVRTAPEQYFWLHRRWKHQPAVRKAKKAA